jgi:hypothetical protein
MRLLTLARASSIAVLLGASALIVGCGKGDDVVDSTSNGGAGGAAPLGPECGSDPWSCPSGQTCWVATDTTWRCQTAGAGTQGTACKAVIGEPACGEGLLCIGADPTKGTCEPACSTKDKSHGCAAGSACADVKFSTPKGVDLTASGCVPKG